MQAVRDAFIAAIDKRLMTDVPYGVLLSGGLDSSLVASLVVKMCDKAGKPRPATFSIGLHNSPDLKNARAVANMLGTEHHEFHFTVQEGIDAVQDVIYHLETYDVTTIRAGTPMFILSRKIKAMGVKMVCLGRELTRSWADTSISTRRLTPRSSTRSASARYRICTSTTASAPTRPPWPGALRHACPSWTRRSWMW